MEEARFDALTKHIGKRAASRRGLLRLGVGGGLGTVLFGRVAQDAAACRQNGRPCDKGKQNGGCCSGTCRKRTCRPTPGAAGCTVNMDFCAGTGFVPCPRQNGFCVVLDTGKPRCVQSVSCAACISDESCTAVGGVPGRCLATCATCTDTDDHACVFAQAVG